MKNLFFFKLETTQTLLFKELMKHIDKSVITKRTHLEEGLELTILQATNPKTKFTVKFVKENECGWHPAYRVLSKDEYMNIADKAAQRLFNAADKRCATTSDKEKAASDKEKAAEAAKAAAKAQEFLNQLSNSNNDYRGK